MVSIVMGLFVLAMKIGVCIFVAGTLLTFLYDLFTDN